MAPVLAVAAPVIGDLPGERLGAVAGLGEDLDRGGDLLDLCVLELLAVPVGGQRGVCDQGEDVRRVAGRRRLDVPIAGADRKYDRGERGVEVGADSGGDPGALAGV